MRGKKSGAAAAGALDSAGGKTNGGCRPCERLVATVVESWRRGAGVAGDGVQGNVNEGR